MRPRETDGGGGKADNRDNGKETVEEEAASIIDACIIGGGVATDDDVRMEVATDITSTSGGAATLHAPFLETPAAGPSARVRPRVTNGGGGKAGNQGNVEEVGPGTGICKGTDGEVGDDNEAGADRPTPIWKRAESAELVRPSTSMEERRPNRNPVGRDQSGRGLNRHD